MDKFAQLLRGFDLDFFGRGSHKMSLEEAIKLKQNDKAVFIDVRSREELDYVSFGFAVNIPITELPDRIDELPHDKTIILFCASNPRATMAYAFLQVKGYQNVRILTNSISEISDVFKPGYVLMNHEKDF